MHMDVPTARCPRCQKTGDIRVTVTFVAAPIGTFSLAGAQMKVSARQVATAECLACLFSVDGRLVDVELDENNVFTGGHFIADTKGT